MERNVFFPQTLPQTIVTLDVSQRFFHDLFKLAIENWLPDFVGKIIIITDRGWLLNFPLLPSKETI